MIFRYGTTGQIKRVLLESAAMERKAERCKLGVGKAKGPRVREVRRNNAMVMGW